MTRKKAKTYVHVRTRLLQCVTSQNRCYIPAPYYSVPHYLYNAHAYLYLRQFILIVIIYRKQGFLVSLTHCWDGLVGEVGIQIWIQSWHAQGNC